MPLERSQNELRAGGFRVRADLSHEFGVEGVESVESAPIQHPQTKRFLPGNDAWKRRELKRLAKAQDRGALLGLDPNKCEEWLQPFAREAVNHAAELTAELPVQSDTLKALADDAAAARAIYRGLLALGVAGDRKALSEARAWLREVRQNTITIKALGKLELAEAKNRPIDVTEWAKLVAEGSKPRERGENET